LFFGTGRYYTATDKCTVPIQATIDKCNVDIQHFFGVKDCIVSSACTDQTVERNNLFNASNVVTCSSCAADTNVSTTGGTSGFTIGFSAGGGSLVNNVQNGDGWFTTFNDPTAPLQTPPRSALTAGNRSGRYVQQFRVRQSGHRLLPNQRWCVGSGLWHARALGLEPDRIVA